MMNPEPNSALNRPPQTVNADDSPWWLKHAVRFIGSAASIAALALGAFACITITPSCLMAGILQMICGVLVALIEAPCLCLFLDFAQVPSTFFDRKPYWHRGLLYIIIAVLPISICPGVSTFFGSGLIFVTGCLYGILALGKKAPVAEMRVKATSSYNLLANAKHPDIEAGGGGMSTNTDEKKPSGAI